MNSPEAMVMIVVDGVIKSDSAVLEKNMSSATLALQSVRDLGMALSFGCLAVAIAVCFRAWKNKS
jgi:hypothetical protein